MIFAQDIKYALRLLSRQFGFSVLTITVVASGVGLSVFLMSFMHAMLFTDLPLPDSKNLIAINGTEDGKFKWGGLNLHDHQAIRNSVEELKEYSVYKYESLNVSDDQGARRYLGAQVEASIFQASRTQALLGRTIQASENDPGAERVVVLSYDLWQTQFMAKQNVLEQVTRINGDNYRIVGVMPEGYLFPSNAELWVPMRQTATLTTRDTAANYYAIAHLADGVAKQQVENKLALVMQRLAEQYPKTNTGISANISTLPLNLAGDGVSVVLSMYVAALLILLLATVNAGNLLLSRAFQRGKETAIRTALGAPRSRLILQMLIESILICAIAGICSFLVMAWGLELTDAVTIDFWEGRRSFWIDIGINSFTTGLFVSVLLITIVITGLLPAWRNSGENFNALLRDGTRGALGRKAGRLNKALVSSEIFLAIAILSIATVVILAALKSSRADYGAQTENTVIANIILQGDKYKDAKDKITLVKELQGRLEQKNEIDSVMVSSSLPGHYSFTPKIDIEGKDFSQNQSARYPRANYIRVMPGSLEKLGIDLRKGRYFDDADEGLQKAQVIVSDSFANKYYPAGDALGKRLRLAEGKQDIWLTIVGVVQHTLQAPANEIDASIPSIYRPYSQDPISDITLAMKITTSQSRATHALREVLRSIDVELPAFGVETYARSIGRNIAPVKLISNIFFLFGIAALVLAASGIYGVMANTIGQRTHEIGVKRSLGALDREIMWSFLGAGFMQYLWGAVPGLIVGGTLGFLTAQAMGTSQSELLLILFFLSMIIAVTVMLATYIPTRKALAMEPSQALRHE